MDNFLGKSILSQFTPLELERPISMKEIKKVIEELPHEKEQSRYISQGDSIKPLKINSMLYISFENIKNKGNLSNSIYDGKPDKDIMRMKFTGKIPHNNSNFKKIKILANKIQHFREKIICHDQVRCIPGIWVNILRCIHIIHQITMLRMNKHT